MAPHTHPLLRHLSSRVLCGEPSPSAGSDACEQVRPASAEGGGREPHVPLASQPGLDTAIEVLHDVRSPLTSILVLAETLQRRLSGGVNDPQHRELALIYEAALGLSLLVADAMETVCGGAELADPEPSPFSLTDVMKSVCDIVRPMAEERRLAIQLILPRVDYRLGHPLALSRVLLNLTTNALKFTDTGFVEIASEETSPTRVTMSVRDTGCGINSEAATSLFQPFRRAHRPSGYSLSGTGLGLAVARRLVEAMHSTLHLQTVANRGTRFYFDLDLPPQAAGRVEPRDLHRPCR